MSREQEERARHFEAGIDVGEGVRSLLDQIVIAMEASASPVDAGCSPTVLAIDELLALGGAVDGLLAQQIGLDIDALQ